jgi:DNA polymerase III delta subunit
MLYVFHGTDSAMNADKAHALVSSLRTKRPDATYVRIDADNWNSSAVQEHVGGQGLFSNKYIVFLDRVTEDRAAKEDLIGLVPLLKESANIFIILEGKVLTDLRKAFESYAEKVVVHDRVDTAIATKTEFNVFALGDAVASRNVFTSWNTYRQAVDSGLEPESIIGTLFWQVKSMIVARDAATATTAGLSPFVFSKAKKYASNYSEVELHNLLQQLIEIYHDAHRGIRNSELAIEKVMLRLKG